MGDTATDHPAAAGQGSPRPVSGPTAALAERMGVDGLALRVVAVVDEAPGLRRVTVEDPRLAGVVWHPGQDLTISVPNPGGRRITRRYSIRSLDRSRATADLLTLVHGDGPGAAWVASVEPGDQLEAIGPRGKIWPREDAAWHLLVGDDTYLGASLAMLESLPAEAEATVVLEVGADVGEQAHRAVARVRGPVWVTRNPVGSGEPGVELVDSLERLDLPAGGAGGHAYLGGEAKTVGVLRGWLVGHGWPADAISAKAYWRADRANQDHGEPEKD